MLHLVLYAEGEPYNSTKKKLIESINNFTTKNVIIHDYNLEKVKQCKWFYKIKELPDISNNSNCSGEDKYFFAWKPFITLEVYNIMNNDDVLYFVDSSRHYKTGFTEKIDKLYDIVMNEGIIAGSIGDNLRNCDRKCCDNLDIWSKIYPNYNKDVLYKKHVNISWYIMIKNDINTKLLNDWVYWCMYKDNELINPLCTYNNNDQTILNILINKYNLKVFYCPGITHGQTKNRNLVLSIINKSDNIDHYFINL